MSITATELKMNLSKYLLLAETEDIYITRNGKVVAKLSNPYQDRVDVAKSLFGSIPADITLEQAREERAGTDMRALVDTCVIVDALQNREPVLRRCTKSLSGCGQTTGLMAASPPKPPPIFTIWPIGPHTAIRKREKSSAVCLHCMTFWIRQPWIAAVPFLPTFRTTRTLSWQKPRCAAVVTAS